MLISIDLDIKLILGVDLFGRHGTDPAAAFLHGISEKQGLGLTRIFLLVVWIVSLTICLYNYLIYGSEWT